MKLKTSERDTRVDLLRKAAKLPAIERPKAEPAKPGAPTPVEPELKMYRSTWVIPQLTSFLYPANRDRLVWRPPGGGEIIFTREEMDAKRYTPEGWLCVEIEPGVFRLGDRDGWAWVYREGLPATLTAPSGRFFDYTHENGLLTRVVQHLSTDELGTNQDVLRVTYDARRRPVRVLAGVLEHRFTYDAQTGHLTAWHSTGLGQALNAAAVREAVDEARPETDPALNLDSDTPAVEGRVLGAVRFAYPNDLLEAMRLPNGKVQRFKWDLAKGTLTADGDALYTHSGTENEGYGLARTDKARRVTTLAQDPRRAQLVITQPDGTREVTAYQRRAAGRGQLRERRDQTGQVLARIDYNIRHLPVRLRTLGEPEVRHVYDEQDRLIEIWRAPGAPFDEAATPPADPDPTAAPRGQRIRHIAYEGTSRQPAVVTDALGRTTRFFYDERAQLIAFEAPDGGTTRFKYDTWGRLVERELPGGTNREFTRYDEQGRVVEVIQPDGRKRTYVYEEGGRLAQRIEDGVMFSHRYDAAGRPAEIWRNQKPWWKWTYAAASPTLYPAKKAPPGWTPIPNPGESQTVAFTDERGGTTTRYYDADGRLILVTNPLGEQTSYRYNAVGEPIGWVDGRGHALMLERDRAGRIVRQANALGQVLTWQYDLAGRLSERANGVQVAGYRFDAAGRLESIDYGAGQKVDYLRDEFGRMVSATTAEVNTRYFYDVLDRVIRIEQRPSNAEASGLAYTYGYGGQKRDVTLLRPGMVADLMPAGTTTTVHDLLGRVAHIEVDGKREATHTYDTKTMRLAAKTLGNGLQYRYRYDDLGRMTELLVRGVDEQPRQRISYDWDAFGLLNKRTLERFGPGAVVLVSMVGGEPAATASTESAAGAVNSDADSAGLGATEPLLPPVAARVEILYSYDELGRLVGAFSPQDARQNRKYAYDAAGNLIENRSPDTWLTMEYDAANQLVVRRERGEDAVETPRSETRFAYDPAGRMLSEQIDGRVERSFTYGYLDKVLRVDRPEGRAAHYAYDASGMLVRKATLLGAAMPGVGPQQETWVWDGLALVQRGDDYFVNEPHLAGGQTLMSRSLNPQPESASAPSP